MEKDRSLALDRLAAGAAEFGLALEPGTIAAFSTYLSLLQLWGRKINLSTRLGVEEVIVYHFLDSLSGAHWFLGSPDAEVIDLGAGAGFPSLPLKLALPDLRVTLIEGSRKKVSFCREVIRATHLKEATALWGRAEEIGTRSEHRGRYAWVVSRAMSQAAVVLKLALPFLAPGGSLLLYKSDMPEEETADLDRLCAELGSSWESRRVIVPHLDGARSHIVVRTAGENRLSFS
jgi:16S rRNA (guanine527-N7)-methyltransferase